MESQNPVRKGALRHESRRSFLGVLLGLALAFVAALLAIPVLRFVFYPLRAKSKSSGWSAAGSSSEATTAIAPLSRALDMKQRDGWLETDTNPLIYLIRKGNKVQALSAICPHLGCTVPWDAAQKEFVCPCHGGTFGPDGSYRSGPPRRGMDTLDTKVANGQVMVKYQTFRPDVPNKEVTS
ncbi:MAG: QcrA and Rieske domain-containing protein [Candidatus Acidiferrales bacterium]